MPYSLLLPFGCYYHTFASPPPPHILELGLRNFPQFGLGQRDLLIPEGPGPYPSGGNATQRDRKESVQTGFAGSHTQFI